MIVRFYKRMRFHIFTLILSCFLVVVAGPSYAMDTAARQAVIVDMQTGDVLYDKNADMRMPTSSMSKVMTMYLVFEALEDGRLKLEDAVTVSEKAWRKGGSKMFIEVGDEVKVEDLIRGVIIQSGNDATIALAEALSGTEDAFARSLTDKAQELGMVNSNFTNASGWPDENHYSTAEDLAILAKALIENFQDYYSYYAEKEFTYNDIKQPNRNPLLYRNIGADGIKTGHTEAGGYGLMASGIRNGRRVIMVLNGMADEAERAQESAKLLDWALREFENVKLFQADEIVETVPVLMGKEKTLQVALKEELFVSIPKGAKDKIKVQTIIDRDITAPVQKGQKIGTLLVDLPGIPNRELELVAAQGIEELGFFAGTFEKLRLQIKSMLAR